MLRYIFDKTGDIPYPVEWPPYISERRIQCTMLRGQCACGDQHRIEDWDLGQTVSEFKELEKRVADLEKCKHQFKTVGGSDTQFRLFYSPKGTGYHQCYLCGYKRFLN